MSQLNVVGEQTVALLGLKDNVAKAYPGETVISPEVVIPVESLPLQYGRRRGGVLVLDAVLFPVVSWTGDVQQVVAIYKGVTEQKATQDALHRYALRLETLHSINKAILEAETLQTIAQTALRHLHTLVSAEHGSIVAFDLATRQVRALAAIHDGETCSRPRWWPSWQIPIEEYGPAERVLRGETIVVEDSSAFGPPYPLDKWLEARGVCCYFNMPLVHHRRVIGALNLKKSSPRAFGREALDIAREVAETLSLAIHNAQLVEQVRLGNENLQKLSQRFGDVQEVERRHLARELHDEIGGTLTALSLLLEMGLRMPLDASRDSIGKAKKLVHQLVVQVRELSLDLRPTMLDDLGLLPTLLWHLDRYTAQTNVQIAFRHSGLDRRFATAVETAVYRIVQEGLTNVARHADVNEVTVELVAEDDTIRLRVEDQGTGFHAPEVLGARSTGGLAGMRERALLLGGCLSIESTPGCGTRLMAELPVGVNCAREISESGAEKGDEYDDDSVGR